MSADEWAEFFADRPPRGATSAQALVATRGAERIRGRREVWARGALVAVPGRGHVPMAEDPDGLVEYLLPVLTAIRDGVAGRPDRPTA